MRRVLGSVASSVLLLGIVSVPAAASAASINLDDGGGIVVGVEIVPRPDCVAGCATPPPVPPSTPPTTPSSPWHLADTGSDISPALLLALALGATGATLGAVAHSRSLDRRRVQRSE